MKAKKTTRPRWHEASSASATLAMCAASIWARNDIDSEEAIDQAVWLLEQSDDHLLRKDYTTSAEGEALVDLDGIQKVLSAEKRTIKKWLESANLRNFQKRWKQTLKGEFVFTQAEVRLASAKQIESYQERARAGVAKRHFRQKKAN